MVLPSFSEGVSRSALEALFLGVPCVLRDVDGASELIHDGINGYLFNENSELHSIEYTINKSNNKFFNNSYENVILKQNAKFKNICI